MSSAEYWETLAEERIKEIKKNCEKVNNQLQDELDKGWQKMKRLEDNFERENAVLCTLLQTII